MGVVILVLIRKCNRTFSAIRKSFIGTFNTIVLFRFWLFLTYKLVILFILFKGAKKPQSKLVSRLLLGLLIRLNGTFNTTHWDF